MKNKFILLFFLLISCVDAEHAPKYYIEQEGFKNIKILEKHTKDWCVTYNFIANTKEGDDASGQLVCCENCIVNWVILNENSSLR